MDTIKLMLDELIFFKSQAVDGHYANYVFEGTGSALSDGSKFFNTIGAVVYSYNQNEVNIWYPGSGDYIYLLVEFGGVYLLYRNRKQRVYL